MADSATATPLLVVEDLSVVYGSGRRQHPAVDGVNFCIDRGETLGLVGESGSGKTTIGKAILGLEKPASGRILFDGKDLAKLPRNERRTLGSQLQVVFQDPYSSLDPTKTIGYTLAEPVFFHERARRSEVSNRVHEMLDRVGLPQSTVSRYPAQFSGGQRQRIAIARALMVSPKLVVCDEPVSALDLSIQAGVINLIAELRRELQVSFLFISHDLSVVNHISERVAVLRRGQIVEYGDAADVYGSPQHEYTRALLDAAPIPDPDVQKQRREERRKRQLAQVS